MQYVNDMWNNFTSVLFHCFWWLVFFLSLLKLNSLMLQQLALNVLQSRAYNSEVSLLLIHLNTLLPPIVYQNSLFLFFMCILNTFPSSIACSSRVTIWSFFLDLPAVHVYPLLLHHSLFYTAVYRLLIHIRSYGLFLAVFTFLFRSIQFFTLYNLVSIRS